MGAKTIARKDDDAQALWVLGGLYEIKVASDESGGELTLMEMTVPPGHGPPAHAHEGAETVYVLEGRLSYEIGDETTEGGPGSVFHIPAGTWEHFEPLGDEPVRVLVSYMPGGIDKFFREIGEVAPTRDLPPPMKPPPDLQKLAAAGKRYGVELRPPTG